jgi:hypothetical protein
LIVTVLKVVGFPFSSHFVTILNPIFLSVAQCVFGCTTLIWMSLTTPRNALRNWEENGV